MHLHAPGPDEAERVVDELWIPLSHEMGAVDSYNELADKFRDAAVEYRREKLAAEDTFIRVAAVDGEWVGYVQATFEESPPVFARGPDLHVNELWVAESERGQAVASRLLDAAEAWGRERGAERVGLHVNVANEAARGLYESRGYETRRLYVDRELS